MPLDTYSEAMGLWKVDVGSVAEQLIMLFSRIGSLIKGKILCHTCSCLERSTTYYTLIQSKLLHAICKQMD